MFKVIYHEHTRKSIAHPINSEEDVDLEVPVEVLL